MVEVHPHVRNVEEGRISELCRKFCSLLRDAMTPLDLVFALPGPPPCVTMETVSGGGP